MALDVHRSEHQVPEGLPLKLFKSVPLGRFLLLAGILGGVCAYLDSKLPLTVRLGPFAVLGEMIVIWLGSRE